MLAHPDRRRSGQHYPAQNLACVSLVSDCPPACSQTLRRAAAVCQRWLGLLLRSVTAARRTTKWVCIAAHSVTAAALRALHSRMQRECGLGKAAISCCPWQAHPGIAHSRLKLGSTLLLSSESLLAGICSSPAGGLGLLELLSADSPHLMSATLTYTSCISASRLMSDCLQQPSNVRSGLGAGSHNGPAGVEACVTRCSCWPT